MKAGITNAYVVTSEDSSLVIESTTPLIPYLWRKAPTSYELRMPEGLIMAPDTLRVFDGLINTVDLQGEGQTVARIELEYPAACRIKRASGLPQRLILSFDRYYVKKMLDKKLIVIDPGHGGRDKGKRGYINLWEKDITLDIADYLKQSLSHYGARPVMTRERDVALTQEERIQVAIDLEADMFLSIHTHWTRDLAVHGSKGLYVGEQGKALCEAIIKELERKMRLPKLGTSKVQGEEYMKSSRYPIPWAWIEVCTISNPVEEGWLRSPVFKERIAYSMVNGIVAYLYSTLRR